MTFILSKKLSVGYIIVSLALISIAFTPIARAETNTSQSAKIQELLKLVEELRSQLAELQGKSGSPASKCLNLTRSLYLGLSDKESEGEVTKLQQFLTSTGHYNYGKVTGYYGPATEQAVKAWQSEKKLVSSGSPETTGFGMVGPSTRSELAKGCGYMDKTNNVKADDSEKDDKKNDSDTISEGSEIDVLVKSNEVKIIGETGGHDIFEFKMELDITAKGSDIFIQKEPSRTDVDRQGGLVYEMRIDNDLVTRYHYGIDHKSTGKESKNKYYVIKQGETETITFSTEVIAQDPGIYRLVLEKIIYQNTSSNSAKKYVWDKSVLGTKSIDTREGSIDKAKESAIKAGLNNMRAHAEIYFNQNNFAYTGVCSYTKIVQLADSATSNGATKYTCEAEDNSYRIWTMLPVSKEYLCLDETGFFGTCKPDKYYK